MSTCVLENECLRVCVADLGAELCSVSDKENGAERLWSADPAIWNRHAPILFPFVGRVTDGKYRVGGKEYEMKTQHGFARDMVFERTEETAASVTHRLCSTAKTREVYPFDFALTVRHSLDKADPRTLRVDWGIQNTGSAEMLCLIGGHPGFLMPGGAEKEDCFLVFPGHETLRYFGANPAGFALPDRQKTLHPDGGFAPYLADIPETWIFEGQGIEEVSIAGPDKKPYVTLRCPGFPMLAVWANPEGPFICLEPWFGRTDDAGFAGTLEEKPGVLSLAPGEKREIFYTMTFHA